MAQWKDKSRKHWLYQFQFKRVRYTQRNFLTKDAAREAEVERRRELKQEFQDHALIPRTVSLGFKEVAYEYLRESERRFTKKTHEYKVLVFKNFHESLPADMPVDEITFRHVEAYLKTRPSNNNWNIHRKELHTLFEWARGKKRHYIDNNPVADVDRMPHTVARKEIPTPAQISQLIDTCDPETELPLFMAILHTLGRVDELLRLTWKDVDLDRNQLLLWTRKRMGGALESDAMPMNKELRKIMNYLDKTRTQDDWVFLNPKTGTRYNRRSKFMKGLCKRAFDPECKSVKEYTGPAFGFHSLRHFMASWLASKGKASLKDLQRLLRHKEIRTTEIYLHQLGDNLREVVKDAEIFKVDVGFGCDSDK